MNIFYLDEDPIVAARYLMDIHVGSKNCGGKMIVESSQMLASAYSLDELTKAPLTKNGKFRSHGYFNHPATVWSRSYLSNFYWLIAHAEEMIKEKIFRGGGLHFCSSWIQWCRNNPPNLKDGFSEPALCMPEDLKVNCPVESYRNYYKTKKYTKSGKKMDVWTIRSTPSWF